jgi:phytoene synthase
VARDTNFYYSFLALSRPKRHAIVAVWDFCRAVDDAVDELSTPAQASCAAGAVDYWREELARAFDGAHPRSREGRALQPLIERFGLPRPPFEQLIDGVEMDIGERRYATFEDLRGYCYRVASCVGLICLEIFGYRNPRARDYAVDLGLALQLTNILRDVGADYGRGRLYLPLEDLERFGCREADIAARRLTPPVVSVLRHQAERAQGFYRSARTLLPREDARRLVAAEIMGAIYRAILRRIEGRGYDVFSEVVRVPRPQRAVIAAATWTRVLAGL